MVDSSSFRLRMMTTSWGSSPTAMSFANSSSARPFACTDVRLETDSFAGGIAMTTRCLLLVGTKKGAFVIESDAARSTWEVRGPLCEGWPIHDLSVDPTGGAILAGGG